MHDKDRQKGFVLISVLLIALLYFGLIELIMAESAEKAREASRFRARITANILTENAAELAATRMTDLDFNSVALENEYGSMTGTYRRVGDSQFVIEGRGSSLGVIRNTRNVMIEGTIEGASINVVRTHHDQ